MSIRDNKRDQLQGTLDLLVLRTLSTGGTMHGYSIADHVVQASNVQDDRWIQQYQHGPRRI